MSPRRFGQFVASCPRSVFKRVTADWPGKSISSDEALFQLLHFDLADLHAAARVVLLEGEMAFFK